MIRAAAAKPGRLKEAKKLVLLSLLFALLFFALLFPWGRAISKTSAAIFNVLSLTGDPGRTKLLFFPPGLQFFEVGLRGSAAFSHLKADEVRAHPAFSKWLALKPGVKLIVQKASSSKPGLKAGAALQSDSRAEALVWLSDERPEGEEEGGGAAIDEPIPFIHIRGRSTGLDLALFQLQKTGLDVSGRIRFRFYVKAPKDNFKRGGGSSAEGEADISGAGIEIKDSLLKTPLGPVNLPALQWGEMRLAASLKNRELTVESFHLGKEGDPLFARLRGDAELRRGRGMRLSRYDFQLQIEAEESLASEGLMRTLDLFLSNTKTALPQSKAVRYSARIRGSGRRVPSIEKLSAF